MTTIMPSTLTLCCNDFISGAIKQNIHYQRAQAQEHASPALKYVHSHEHVPTVQ